MAANAPSLALLTDDVVSEVFVLRKPTALIGRSTGSDIRIQHGGVSMRHACIRLAPSENSPENNDIYVEDLGSTNGTRVNDEPIVCQRLRPNDLVNIGSTRFKVIENFADCDDTTSFITLD